MKALRLDLFQETACYRKPFAIKISETYPLPPYSTINGLLHRILDAKEYIPMRISIQGDYESLVNEYQTTYFYKKNTVTKMPMNQHLLLNVKLIVHINAEDSVLDKLYDRIKNLDEFLSLGRREDLLRIDDVQFVELNEYEVGSDVEDDEDDDIPKKENYQEKIIKFSDSLAALKNPEVSAELKNNYLKSIIERIDYTRESPVRITKKSCLSYGIDPKDLKSGGNWYSPPFHIDIKLRL